MLTVSGLVIEAGAAAATVFAVEGDLAAEDITKAVVPDVATVVVVGLGSSLMLLKASKAALILA